MLEILQQHKHTHEGTRRGGRTTGGAKGERLEVCQHLPTRNGHCGDQRPHKRESTQTLTPKIGKTLNFRRNYNLPDKLISRLDAISELLE